MSSLLDFRMTNPESEQSSEPTLRDYVKRAARYGFYGAIPCFLISAVGSMFLFVLGQAWADGGDNSDTVLEGLSIFVTGMTAVGGFVGIGIGVFLEYDACRPN